MADMRTRPPELALPVAIASGVARGAHRRSVGADAAAHALREAGYAAGDAFFRVMAGRPR
jgi:hypothetical protein